MSITRPDVELRHRARARARLGARDRPGARGRLGASPITLVMLPVVIVAVVLALAIGSDLRAYGGNLTGFIEFGSHFAGVTHPSRGARIGSPQGYDGQFFYVQALDPLLVRNATVSSLQTAGEGFRLQRVAYPALAFLLAVGRTGAVPFALLLVNILVLLALATGMAIYARRRGWSTLWATAFALMPGMLLPTLRDLSDPLATATMLAGLLAWQSGRRWPAALALTVAVLAREVMIVAVVAVAAEAGARAWRTREVPGEWRRIASRVWPVVVIPSAVFAAWQAYITARYGGPVGGANLSLPLLNLVQEVRWSMRLYPPLTAAWDLVYVLLILAAAGAALMSLRQRVTITSAGACALALGVLVPTLGDVWSDTRLSAPLFALLLLDGLQRRNRCEVLIGAAAAGMTILIPFALPGPF